MTVELHVLRALESLWWPDYGVTGWQVSKA